MRWRKCKKPEIGDARTIVRFLFLPRTIAGQTRWLEWATIAQKYDYPYGWFGTTFWDKEWGDVSWEN